MLDFPNQSRVFDPTRRAVRFWGHDGAMEWSFYVSEDALKLLATRHDARRDGFAFGLRYLSVGDLRGGQEGVQAQPQRVL